MAEVEIWLPVVGFEDRYEVSDHGNVRSVMDCFLNPKEPKIKASVKNRGGYVVVSLYKNSKMYCKKIHRLVAETFIPNPMHKKCVNHKDCDKTNNHVTNLEWVTHGENSNHAAANGRLPSKKGQMSPVAIWNDAEVIAIKTDINNGTKASDLYRKYPKLNSKHLYLFRTNKTWLHLNIRVEKTNKSRTKLEESVFKNIIAYKYNNPKASDKEISDALAVSKSTVYRTLKHTK